MSLSINTNTAALNAQGTMRTTNQQLATTLNRLSTGFRITEARDDAAGLAISARLSVEIDGLKQGARNGSDGVSLLQTAENALNASLNTLQRMSQLASQAASGTYSEDDRANLNNEFVALLAELDSVANSTQFNGVQLLNVPNTGVELNPVIEDAVTNVMTDIQNILGQAAINAGDGNAGDDARAALHTALELYFDGANITAAVDTMIDDQLSGLIDPDPAIKTAIVDALEAVLGGIDAVAPAGPAGTDAAEVVDALGTLIETELENALDAIDPEDPFMGNPNSGEPQTINIFLGGGGSVSLSLVDARATTLVGTNDPNALNISDVTNANAAITALDAGINIVTQSLSRLGADSSKLEAAVNRNLSSATQLEGANSRIRDTDYAEESGNLARLQILQQAGAAMLSRANAQPQVILSLIQQL